MSIAGLGPAAPAADFFVDYLTTALEPAEVLTGIRVPKLAGWGYHYEKFHRTAQAWAIVGVAALTRRSNGQVAEARIGLTNMGPVPVRATSAEAAATGAEASRDALRAANRSLFDPLSAVPHPQRAAGLVEKSVAELIAVRRQIVAGRHAAA